MSGEGTPITSYDISTELRAKGLSNGDIRELGAPSTLDAHNYVGFHLGTTEGLIKARGGEIPESLSGDRVGTLRETIGYQIGIEATALSVSKQVKGEVV